MFKVLSARHTPIKLKEDSLLKSPKTKSDTTPDFIENLKLKLNGDVNTPGEDSAESTVNNVIVTL